MNIKISTRLHKVGKEWENKVIMVCVCVCACVHMWGGECMGTCVKHQEIVGVYMEDYVEYTIKIVTKNRT
jgi:hypothetical protein